MLVVVVVFLFVCVFVERKKGKKKMFNTIAVYEAISISPPIRFFPRFYRRLIAFNTHTPNSCLHGIL